MGDFGALALALMTLGVLGALALALGALALALAEVAHGAVALALTLGALEDVVLGLGALDIGMAIGPLALALTLESPIPFPVHRSIVLALSLV